jgi:hypothetical protein
MKIKANDVEREQNIEKSKSCEERSEQYANLAKEHRQ